MKMKCTNAYKNVQRRYYDLLSYKYSTLIITLLSLLLFLTFLNFGEVWLLWGRERYDSVFSSFTQNIAGKSFQNKLCQAVPIDVVYTWVNGSDPAFLRELQAAMLSVGDASISNDTTAARYRDKQELRYSLRSLEKFAPWVRHVYIVTNGQIPYWLNLDCPHVTLVTHAQIFPHVDHLPTFSSPAIEAHLHRIPGLSELFLYFNDDVILGKEAWPEDFMTLSRGFKVFLSWAIPDCSAECPWAWVGDGTCDPPCNTSRCAYDEGDCARTHPGGQFYPKYIPPPDAAPLQPDNDTEILQQIQNIEKMYSDLRKNGSNQKISKKLLPSHSSRKLKSMVLNHRQVYPTPQLGETNKLREILASHKLNISEAVKRANANYLEKRKALRESRKMKKMRKRRGSRMVPVPEEGGKVQDVVVKVYPSDIKFLHDGEVYQAKLLVNETLEKMDVAKKVVKKQRKLDMFGESLLFVHRLYNKAFGVKQRKVPAHMPHLISKPILTQLHHRFPMEWQETSRHKLRHPNDMQLAFSYFHFLTSGTVNRTVDDIFDEFDTDRSGTWSDREMRTLLTRLYGTPLTLAAVMEFESIIVNCSRRMGYSHDDVTPAPYDRYADSTLPTVSRRLVRGCAELLEALHDEFPPRKLYRTEIVPEKQQDAVFATLEHNLSQVLDTLDYLRANQRKFMCLNDNIGDREDGQSQEEMIVAVLQDFYESLYPQRSSFELPPRLRNRFANMAEYEAWRGARFSLLTTLMLVFLLASLASLYACYTPEVNGCLFRTFLRRRHADSPQPPLQI